MQPIRQPIIQEADLPEDPLNSNPPVESPSPLLAVQDIFLNIQSDLVNQYEELNQRVLQLSRTNRNLKILAGFTTGLAIAMVIINISHRVSKSNKLYSNGSFMNDLDKDYKVISPFNYLSGLASYVKACNSKINDSVFRIIEKFFCCR
ncbi:MAG: hypothetical protein HWD61_03665 [Parachlamydiaceae bacterium]|nr:MAG: hypothetical protein HWD61_03665 [Parachlamydiaceae bacterium]